MRFEMLRGDGMQASCCAQVRSPSSKRPRSHPFRIQRKQQAFLDFVLAHYVSEGVEELDQKKLTPLLRLKYHDSLSDAVADLGKPEEIGRVFAGF